MKTTLPLRVTCCHGNTVDQCDGSCTDDTRCTPPITPNPTTGKQELMRELTWFRDLIVAMLKAGYSSSSIASLSVEDWHEYFIEGITPIEALREDESNG